MYDELMRELRELAEWAENTEAFVVPKLLVNKMRKAANAIEELSKRANMVKVRHGQWKLHEDGSGTCQECGCLQKCVWDMDGWQNYCGHCGADMRNGGQDNG